MDEKIDKRKGALPVYMQLAQIIRNDISTGKLKPGDRIPTESKLAQKHGVSVMTIRQAVSILVDEKLVQRVHGSGTFVRKVDFAATSFGLDVLKTILSDKSHVDVQILRSIIERVGGKEGDLLQLESGDPIILVERLISYRKEAFALQSAYMPFDPKSPVVEDMLDTIGLSGLLLNTNLSGYKKGSLHLLPMTMSRKESELLSVDTDNNAFKLEYIFYNYNDKPCAYGWFIIPHQRMPISSQVGVWNE